jgi:NAD(P)H-hydrate repair Nnr-like enzyme with NAD(P)H-hydrate epimerase domain
VVGEEGEVVSVTAEQMSAAEKLALETGMSEDVLIENAGNPDSDEVNIRPRNRRGSVGFIGDETYG